MDNVQAYRDRARSLSVEAFASLLPRYFLIKHARPSGVSGPRRAPSWEWDFATSTIPAVRESPDEEMQLAPVRKRPGNPFPDHITIGRASNCDVVWRYPYVSKVHAHLLCQPDGSLSVQDRDAANFTSVNQRRLAPRETTPLNVGDVLGLGSLALELYDSKGLHALLCGGRPRDEIVASRRGTR